MAKALESAKTNIRFLKGKTALLRGHGAFMLGKLHPDVFPEIAEEALPLLGRLYLADKGASAKSGVRDALEKFREHHVLKLAKPPSHESPELFALHHFSPVDEAHNFGRLLLVLRGNQYPSFDAEDWAKYVDRIKNPRKRPAEPDAPKQMQAVAELPRESEPQEFKVVKRRSPLFTEKGRQMRGRIE